MDNIAGTKSSLTWAVHISVVGPGAALAVPDRRACFVSSFRTADQIAASGWWKALFPAEQTIQLRTAGPATQRCKEGDLYVVEGNLLRRRGRARRRRRSSSWAPRRAPSAPSRPARPPSWATARPYVLEADGSYRFTSAEELGQSRPAGLRHRRSRRPNSRSDNYETVLFSRHDQDNMAKAFFNTLTVTIPATIIPIVDRGLRGLCAGVDGFPGPRAADRAGRRRCWSCRCNWR